MHRNVTLLLALLLIGCATPYQKIGTSVAGGHMYKQVAPDVFVVAFMGNGFTDPKRANDFAMLRAAEVSLEHSYRFFVVLAEGDRSHSETMHIQQPTYTSGVVNNYGSTTTFSAVSTPSEIDVPVFKPASELTIRCFEKRPDSHAGKIYDASSVATELRAKYKLK